MRVDQLKELSRTASVVSEQLSDGRAPTAARVHIPSEFYQAFVSAVIFMVGFQPKEQWSQTFHRYTMECSTRINKGQTQLVERFKQEDLSGCEAVLPVGVMGLIVHNLHQDVTHREPYLLYNAYREYLNRLVSRVMLSTYLTIEWCLSAPRMQGEVIRTEPKNRNHQTKILYVKQELSVIISVLSDQNDLLNGVLMALGPVGTGPSATFNASGSEGSAMSTFSRTKVAMGRKLEDFRRLADIADDLVAEVRELRFPRLCHELTMSSHTLAACVGFAIVSIPLSSSFSADFPPAKLADGI